ncbi:MAG: nucleotidyltransferase family protein [Coprococcus sp.]
MKISLILLAAGDSRRFGSNKLLYELHGKPMYRYSVDEVAKLDTTVFAEKIVVSQYDEILDTLSREGYLTVRNTESYLGISHSIQLGLAASGRRGMVFPCGRSAVPESSRRLKDLWKHFKQVGRAVACVRYGNRTGNPCIFTSEYQKELLELAGDIGGSAS